MDSPVDPVQRLDEFRLPALQTLAGYERPVVQFGERKVVSVEDLPEPLPDVEKFLGGFWGFGKLLGLLPQSLPHLVEAFPQGLLRPLGNLVELELSLGEGG